MSGSVRLLVVFGLVLLLGVGWGGVWLNQHATDDDGAGGSAEAYSLLGEALSVERYRATFGAERMAQVEADLAAAARLALNESSEEHTIWHGRRLAYHGEYRAAIATYTEGLLTHPDSYKLLRHRGHRYLTRRQLYAAVQDLTQATRLIADLPDEIEPDGIPNALNDPRSTLHGNIWYHLGLALYLQGDFIRARPAWNVAMQLSTNDDTLCSASYWTYLTLRRLGEDDEATALLSLIHPEMDVIENGAYRDLLLMFKGELSPDMLMDGQGDAIENATIGYGVGAYHLINGDIERARNILRRIVAGAGWPAFGHIAAEAELLHMGLGN